MEDSGSPSIMQQPPGKLPTQAVGGASLQQSPPTQLLCRDGSLTVSGLGLGGLGLGSMSLGSQDLGLTGILDSALHPAQTMSRECEGILRCLLLPPLWQLLAEPALPVITVMHAILEHAP